MSLLLLFHGAGETAPAEIPPPSEQVSARLPTGFDIIMTDDEGNIIAVLDEVESFDYVKVVNDVGWFTIVMPASFAPASQLAADNILQFWRQPAIGDKALDFCGFLRRWIYSTDDDGSTIAILSGPDQNDILARRIVAYDADDTKSELSVSNVDDAMKDLVNENLLAGATDTARDISGNGLSNAADESAGPDIDKEFAWRPLLAVLQDLNAASETAGTQVYFGIEPVAVSSSGALTFQFRTYTGQPGDDLTWGTADNPVIFGLEFGNLAFPTMDTDYTDEINYVYAGGQGEGSNREVVEVSDTDRIGISIWNRREGFADARNQSTTAGVTAAGNALLAEKRPQRRFSGDLLDSEQAPYGTWNLGDRVTATYLGFQFNGVVEVVTVKWGRDGLETIRGRLGDVAL